MKLENIILYEKKKHTKDHILYDPIYMKHVNLVIARDWGGTKLGLTT